MRFFAAALVLLTVCGSACAHPTVYFEPDHLMIEPGQPCTLGIRVDNGADTLTCFRVRFSFDTDVLELNSAQEGSLFSESGHQTMFDWDELSPGHHECNDVTLGFDAFVLCPGELVHVEFQSGDAGTTTIALYDVDLRDLRRDPILPVGIGDCQVTVGPLSGVSEGPEETAYRLRCFPNPFRGELRLQLEGDVRAAANFRLFDVSGRVVAERAGTLVSSGGAVAIWDGTDASGIALPAGVYFIEATDGRAVVKARATLLR